MGTPKLAGKVKFPLGEDIEAGRESKGAAERATVAIWPATSRVPYENE